MKHPVLYIYTYVSLFILDNLQKNLNFFSNFSDKPACNFTVDNKAN